MEININTQEEYEREVERCIRVEMQTLYPEEYKKIYGEEDTTNESLNVLRQEIDFFKQQNLWTNGYMEGNPLDPLAVPNSFVENNKHIGFAKVNGKPYLNVVYEKCIKPYINSETKVLEIGPGGGTWTQCMLSASEIYTLDVIEEGVNFQRNVRSKAKAKVNYIVVKDFSCSDLPDNYFDYMFSFGCLCHVSFDGVTEYAKNIFEKLKSGANCFWMIADEEKFAKDTGREAKMNWPSKFNNKLVGFYKQNVAETCLMLKSVGYEIISEDLDLIFRDPIIYFKKP